MKNTVSPDWRDIPAALALLTRLPLPASLARHFDRGAQAAWAYPLAGVAVALVGTLGAVPLLAFGLPTGAAALTSLAAMVLVTGALHEDGLADAVDGFWGSWTRERRLEIMRDSRIGSYGVIALVLSLLARWFALTSIWALPGLLQAIGALITAAALSRAVMPVLMATLPHARSDGLSRQVGRAPSHAAWLAVLLALVIAVICSGAEALGAVIVALLAGLAVRWLARSKIGGQTGDILGAGQQLAEVAVLFALIPT